MWIMLARAPRREEELRVRVYISASRYRQPTELGRMRSDRSISCEIHFESVKGAGFTVHLHRNVERFWDCPSGGLVGSAVRRKVH